jgi:WD40 repeat protein
MLPTLTASGSDEVPAATPRASSTDDDEDDRAGASAPTVPGHLDETSEAVQSAATRTSEPRSPDPSDASRVPSARHAGPAQYRDPERYEILGEHGRGGLGRVSRAHDLDLGRDIAIKELISRGHVSEVRFLREALITARLEHPGIVPIYEAGRWPDGTPFYAMKLVAGRSLRELITEHTTVEQRVGLLHHVIAVADAIAYAHGRNIIHRDLKPANVIVGDFGETIVIDWGLAKDLTVSEESLSGGPVRPSADDDLTSAGSVLGTPAYMAPEQGRGEPVDQRADVFAIGAMLWELCAPRKRPPVEPHLRRRMLRHAGIDNDLIAIIDKALDAAPERRYPDAGALAADLKAFKSGMRIAARSYSLFAMLAHWTRRHRALALSSTAIVALAVTGAILYVRNVAAARDRADRSLVVAHQERDRAQLAQASLLVEQDPTTGKELLASLAQRTPQSALLLSRANRLGATREVRLPGNASALLLEPSAAAVVVVTGNGSLASVDLDTGRVRVLQHDALGAVAASAHGWIYAHRSAATSGTAVTDTSAPARPIETGSLLSDPTGQLLVSGSHLYALDSNDLYSLDQGSPSLVSHGVRSIAGSAHLLLVCTTANALDVTRDGAPERQTRCAKNTSKRPMAVAGDDYAALLDDSTLLVVRDGKPLELATHVTGEYQLALSTSGIVALSDFEGKTWFLRPGADHLELGPVHASQPIAVAADDRYAAWGYMDGAVTAIDIRTNTSWEFKGHGTRVSSIAIDARSPAAAGAARVISTAGPQLRVWALAASRLTKVADVPCKVFNLARSLDDTRAAIDCGDGSVRVWSIASGVVQEVHRHSKLAFGVAWWRDLACSAGFDGLVMCSARDGTTRNILSSPESVRWIAASPDNHNLVMATADGKIRDFDDDLRVLYAHTARPYRMAFSSDGQLLASGAADGSVIVYDRVQQRVVGTVTAHTSLVTNVAWRDHDLWTAGADGTVKHWRLQASTLVLVDSAHDLGAFRFFHLISNGWLASIDDRFLLVSRPEPTGALRLDALRHIEHVEVSPDERYIAVTVAGEIIVVDLVRHAVTSLNLASDGVGYVGFATPGLLAVSTGNGLFSVSLSELDYITFDSSLDN